jgi:Phosphoesterase family
MQENRSFDSHFGTYPGADGIPAGVCVPDPLHEGCVRPYPDHHNSELGGPHEDPNFSADVDGGRMDGFVAQAETKGRCAGSRRCRAAEVMGYHTGSDIPDYSAPGETAEASRGTGPGNADSPAMEDLAASRRVTLKEHLHPQRAAATWSVPRAGPGEAGRNT